MQCVECPTEPAPVFEWSYNMKDHWERVHDSLTMPSSFAAEIQLGPQELQWLKTLGNGEKPSGYLSISLNCMIRPHEYFHPN